MSREVRLLEPSLLPGSLWDSENEVLILPAAVAESYERVVDRHGLRGLAAMRDMNDPPVGGLDQERTNRHFAQAFDGSCARVQLALLDPKDNVPRVSNAFISCLAGNGASLTDAPCGAGAAAFSFLAIIAELRAQKVLPREPLHIVLIGAELSEPARAYAQEMLAELRSTLESQAIFVEAEWIEWDVTSRLSNTDLVQKMTLAAAGKARRLLVVANFNSFLEKERKKKEALPQLEELFRHASGDNSMAIWIEPHMNRAIVGLFPWLRGLLKDAWRLFAREDSGKNDPEPLLVSNARFRLPLTPDKTARVGLAVIAIDLIRQK